MVIHVKKYIIWKLYESSYNMGMIGAILKKVFMPQQVPGLGFTSNMKPVHNTTVTSMNAIDNLEIKPKVKSYATHSSVSPYKVVTVSEANELAETTSIVENHHISFSKNILGVSPDILESLCRVATINDCVNMKVPAEHWVPFAHLYNATNGNPLKLTEFLATSTPLLKNVGLVNFKQVVPKVYSEVLPVNFQQILSSISLKTQNSVPYEILSTVKVNKDFIHNRLGFANKNEFRYEGDLSSWRNYVNQTRNKHPDYVLVLSEPVNVNGELKDLVAYDLKFGQLQPPVNIVKACTTKLQFIEKLEASHGYLGDHLKSLAPTLSYHDGLMAKAISKELTANLNFFRQTQNIENFRSTYHGLHEKYSGFFLRNGVGYNFLVQLSVSDFAIPKSSQSYFSDSYKAYMSSQNTLVTDFAKKVSSQNSLAMEANDWIKNFAIELLHRK